MPFRCGNVRKSLLNRMIFPEMIMKLLTKQKMHGSLQNRKNLLTPKSSSTGSRIEKASPSAPASGSVTIEAALVLPIFMFAMISLLYLVELIGLFVTVNLALYNVAKETASYGYGIEKAQYGQLPKGMSAAGITNTYLRGRVNRELKAYESICAPITGGCGGVSLAGSRYDRQTGRLYMRASYQVRLPFHPKGVPAVKFQSRLCAKLWNGYLGEGFGEGGSEEMVYITKTGTVYHLSLECTHLKLSIRSVDLASLEGLRNKGKAKYYPCERCIGRGVAPASVYITDYGNSYHNSLTCSGLKRSVKCVPLSKVGGRGPCSKCKGR